MGKFHPELPSTHPLLPAQPGAVLFNPGVGNLVLPRKLWQADRSVSHPVQNWKSCDTLAQQWEIGPTLLPRMTFKVHPSGYILILACASTHTYTHTPFVYRGSQICLAAEACKRDRYIKFRQMRTHFFGGSIFTQFWAETTGN